MNIIFCSSCNKQITNTGGDAGIVTLTSAIFLSLNAATENDPNLEYLKTQFGQYNPCKTYNICYECVLRAFGVKTTKEGG